MKTLKLIKEVEDVFSQTPDGKIQDADTILSDLVEKSDTNFSGIAFDIFEIYKNSKDPDCVEKMFYEFTGVEFDEYLKMCIKKTSTPEGDIKSCPREVLEAYRIATKLNLTKDNLLMEAELIENEGEWLHMSLMGYDVSILRKVAEMM